MIKGLARIEPKKLETNYRDLAALNSSMIRLFDDDPVMFYKQFKLGMKKKDKKTTALLLGDLVDFYLLDCRGDEQEFENRFDEKFTLYDGIKGSGQAFLLADILYEITQDCTNEKDEVTVSFNTRFKEALQKVQAMGQYRGKSEEKALEDFNDKALEYYESLITSSSTTVVDISLTDKARKISKLLLADTFTSDVFTNSEQEETFFKFPIEWVFSRTGANDIKCKCEPDILRINHGKKTIYLGDLKTTYDNENFEYSYIKNSYYLQSGFYQLGVRYWADQEGLTDYTVLPMEYIVADTSANNRRPLRYKTTKEDYLRAVDGFFLRGAFHRGVFELMEEISWAEENNIWNCSKEAYDSQGVMKLCIKYE